MTSLILFLLFLALWTASCADEHGPSPKLVTTTSPLHKTTANITISPELNKNISTTAATKIKNPGAGLSPDGDMIQRALYVLIGITAIGVLYFLVRAVRMKKSTGQRRKYGLLTNQDDTMEMGHLESDEEDNTVFEASAFRR
ncbi:Membrane protein FAM174A [Triplophysa tibetana]|uniref:Membrane protein FAM174A n=1 Tax=Triplophysa tibetana TaxID=1572043 RepID=A0A5A9NF97_9TELE|nr:Membrane protein FAM174A [Triplophysa tibetana]